MDPYRPTADMTVAEVLDRWPAALAVFVRRRMACPGCAMTPFMTLAEAARSYRLDTESLIEDIVRVGHASV